MATNPPTRLPRGYYIARTTPSMLDFFEPSSGTQSEIDFNQFMFMTLRLGGGENEFEDVSSPESQWEAKLKDMVMFGENGQVTPAFLPHFVDVAGKMSLPIVFRQLQNYKAEYDGVSKIVPKALKRIVDPKPKIKFEGPIYELDGSIVELRLGCLSDGLALYRLKRSLSEVDMVVTRGYRTQRDPGSRFHGVRITPQTEAADLVLDPGMIVIVWNVRHAARPSFRENFARLVQLHNPVAFLLTETRMYKSGFLRLDDLLDTNMTWGLDESIGLGGGCALMWDKARAKGKTMVSGRDVQEIRMLASLKPPGAASDPSSPEGSTEI